MPLHYLLHILVHLLEGLQYAHEVKDFDGTPLNLVHRDVSPHNVLVTYDGQIKVLDFGIAKALDSSQDTRTGVLKGKVAYMPPEQASGDPIDRRADVFSAGVMLWEFAVGRRMWDRSLRDMQILSALMKGAIPPPREHAPDIDPQLEQIILKATAPWPKDRYATAAEMQADVERLLKSLEVPSFGSRDIGKFVADLFADERDRIKGAIDEQLGLMRGAQSGAYSQISMRRLSSPPGAGGTPSGILVAMGDGSTDRGRSAMDPADLSASTRKTLPPPKVQRKRRRVVALSALVALGLLGAGFAFRVPIVAAIHTDHAAAPGGSENGAPSPSGAPAASAPVASATSSATPASSAVDGGASVAATKPGESASAAASATAAASAGAAVRWYPTHPTGPASPPPTATATSTAAPPQTAAATAAATAASPPPSATSHVRQQIDTANPYGH
jgi:serine/threonine-protein kinase